MHAGQETKMLRGAIWACVIPVAFGLLMVILILLTTVNVTAARADVWGVIPIFACFIFGPPMAAWLACRSLRKIGSVKKLSLWKTSATRGFLSASIIHFIWAGLYTIGWAAFIQSEQKTSFPDLDPSYNALAGIFVSSFVMNLMLWIIITLPLSLLCATIFWKVTKFPEDTSVF